MGQDRPQKLEEECKVVFTSTSIPGETYIRVLPPQQML